MRVRRTIAGTFDPAASYVARRPLTLNGRRIAPGEPVDLRSIRRGARVLYEGRYVVKALDELASLPAAAGGKRHTHLSTAHRDDASGRHGRETQTRSIRHRGGGFYDVLDQDGNAINDRALRRHEAEALLS